jgi:hypothetical protein
MNRLNELEQELAREVGRTVPSPLLEARLLRHFEKKHSSVRRVIPIATLLAVAASLLLLFWPKPKPHSTPAPLSARVVIAPPPSAPITPVVSASRPHKARPKTKTPAAPEQQFVQIPYSTPLAPWERAEIVRVEMPIAALAAAGFHVAVADTGARAQADLVIGEDGMARAVRLISVSSN